MVNGFGRRLNQIGPFQVADFAGVDLVQKTSAVREEHVTMDTPSPGESILSV